MCGIAGILARNAARAASLPPLGPSLLTMAACLQHRGSDSAGVALFDASGGDGGAPLRLQTALAEGAPLPEPQAVAALAGGRLSDLRPEPGGFSAAVAEGADVADLVAALERGLPGTTVTAAGRAMRIQKSVGPADGLVEAVAPRRGTHGIAHLRLATESRIDPAHAQPFWGRPYPDIAVTHNGHITNYYKLRQRFEARGFTFASRNDSEIIGVYLGDRMAGGATLREALEAASHDLDGSFSFIAATATGLGVTRDPFATKPLLYAESADGVVALASEMRALHHVLSGSVTVREVRPREVLVWETAS